MFENRITKIAKVCFLMLFCAFAPNIFAQSGATVSGLVMIEDKPIANAKVTLEAKTGQVFETRADANGKYTFSDVVAGDYTITATNETSFVTSKIIKVEKGQSLTVDLDIKFDARRSRPIIETVTVSAGISQPLDQVSKTISTESGFSLDNRQEISVVDALRTVPGFRVQQLGGFGRLGTIKTRGLRNQDTAVLIDGQRFRDAAAISGDASSFLSDLVPSTVTKVEVLRGAGSSLYGTNAIGGTLNIITDEGTGKFNGNLLAEGGGLGFGRARLQISESLLNGKFRYSSGFAQTYFGKGVDGNDLARNTTINGKTSYEIVPQARIFFGIYGANSFVELNSSPDTVGTLPATGIIKAVPLSRAQLKRFENGTPRNQLTVGNANFIPDANDGDASQKSRFLTYNFGLSGFFNQNATYKISYQNLATARKNFNGRAGIGFQPSGSTRSDFIGNIQTFRAVSTAFIRANTLTFGYEFERENYKNKNFNLNSQSVVNNSVDATQKSNTLFLQNLYSAFNRRLSLAGGVRAQFFSLNVPKFAGANPIYQNLTLENLPKSLIADGSIAYFFPQTNTKIRAHIGNGYRIPSLYERFGTFFSSFSGAFVALGDPNLKPEKTISVDGGIEQSLAQNRVRLSAVYFYNKLIKTIDFRSGVPPIGSTPRPFGGYFNSKGAIARGAELSATFRPFDETDIFTSYTYTNSDQRAPQVTGSGILQTLGVPEHQFTLVFNQRIAKRLNVNFDFVGTSSYLGNIFSNQTFTTRVYRFAGNRKGDLGASYTLPLNSEKLSLKFFGKIENIFNQDYYENGFRTARSFGRGGLQLNF